MKKIIVITGGSSGIGRAAAGILAGKGCTVYELSRRDVPQEGVRHLTADVTDEAAVQASIASVLEAEGHIDVLILSAGFGISGAVEFTDPKEAHAQIDVNLFGTDRVVRAVLPHMRERRAGRILCVSSVAGLIGIPYQTWYSVSKAAVNAYVSGLQNEVRQFGITVCAVLPGDICTGFTDARQKSLKGNDLYGGRIAKSVAGMEKDERNGISPEVAGGIVARYALKKHSKPFPVIGLLYKGAALLIKFLPGRLASWIAYQLYG